MLDREQIEEIYLSPVMPRSVNAKHYIIELLEDMHDEDLWIDRLISSFSHSPMPNDAEGHILVILHGTAYDEDGDWEGFFEAGWSLDYKMISSPIGPHYQLEYIEVYDEE